jgi:hypothetical protein
MEIKQASETNNEKYDSEKRMKERDREKNMFKVRETYLLKESLSRSV